MENQKTIQTLVEAGPCRGLIKRVWEEVGGKYVTVRWRIVESKRMTDEKKRFLALAEEIARENAEMQSALDQINVQFSGQTVSKAS